MSPLSRYCVPSRRASRAIAASTATLIAALASFAAGCSAHTASRPAPASDVVRAGSRDLAVAHIVDDVDSQRVMFRAASGDTTAKQYGRLRIEQRVALANGTTQVLLYKLGHYTNAEFSDTMSMTRDGLRPIAERMQSGKTVKIIHYAGDRLHETVQVGDSAPRALDRSFPVPVFAFNQLELVVRSLPLRTGLHAILPLYSEGDDSLEMDTASVVRLAEASDSIKAPAWIVRFADPAIVSTYVVDTLSRRIDGYYVESRKSGAHTWIER
jgi:hypothetical protein